MTESVAHPEAEALRLQRGSEAWLLGAFLVFFGVAIASAMPAISAAVRSAAADAARGIPGASEIKIRAVVRVELASNRATLPQFPGGDAALAPVSTGFVHSPFARPIVALRDLGPRIRELGFNARAPPLSVA
ncbi:MAG: hypothetical protein KBA31_15150 [Alphaproteobacteria bacterium]|nr:hypothetical protein [Alphaproteobacteria bacterium]